jgi:hypothetical protein
MEEIQSIMKREIEQSISEKKELLLNIIQLNLNRTKANKTEKIIKLNDFTTKRVLWAY